VVCASSRHRLAKARALTIADVAAERWAMPFSEPTLISHRWLYQRLQDAGAPPPGIAFQSRSAVWRLRVTARSDLLTFASRSIIRETGESVRPLPIPELTLKLPVAVIHRHEAYVPPTALRFVDAMKAAAKLAA
jgi:DNA-binding transcriptional LysR family regulator